MENERRQDRVDLIAKFDQLEQDFNELKIEVKESIVLYNSFIAHTADYRKNLCDKLDAFSRLDDKIFDRIDKITQNCIDNIPKYIKMEKHIKDEENNKTLFKDKKFRFLLLFAGAMFSFMFWVLKTTIMDDNKKLEQKISQKERAQYEQNTRHSYPSGTSQQRSTTNKSQDE